MTDAQQVVELLETTRTIALVGASHKPHRDSYRVMQFLLACGYKVIPVNPGLAGQTLLGQQVVAALGDIDEPVDLVDIFRNADVAGEIVDQAIEMGAKAVWMQLGVINLAAKMRAEAAGLVAVMDRCPRIDIPRFQIKTPALS